MGSVVMGTLERRYRDRLTTMPAPGGGRHNALLAIANIGILAGLTGEQIHEDIRRAADMPDREIQAAIEKAARDHSGGTYRPPPKPAPIVTNGNAARRRIIEQGTISEDVALWECSPIRLHHPPEQDPVVFLSAMFKRGDILFIGGQHDAGTIGGSIRSMAEWIEFFKAGGKAGPFIIVNPFSGKPAPKKDGSGDSLRCDGAIASYPHCLVEFDTLSNEDQVRFWSAARLPIKALTHTGGKSIHAWLDVSKLSNVTTADDWNQAIKIGLYEKVLVPMGVDRTCCNPARLSRMPGWFRSETGKIQKILWLSSDGREVVR